MKLTKIIKTIVTHPKEVFLFSLAAGSTFLGLGYSLYHFNKQDIQNYIERLEKEEREEIILEDKQKRDAIIENIGTSSSDSSVEDRITSYLKIERETQLGNDVIGCYKENSKKPNALFVFPIYDIGNLYYNKYTQTYFRWVAKRYNTKVIVAGTEEDIYKAIDSTKNIELLMLNAHASKHEQIFGQINQDTTDEKMTIDTSDTEFKEHLNKLNPNAVIFLNGCSTAEGREKEDNLTNFIKRMSGKRKVMGLTSPGGIHCIPLTRRYPYNINFMAFGVKNIIYTAK